MYFSDEFLSVGSKEVDIFVERDSKPMNCRVVSNDTKKKGGLFINYDTRIFENRAFIFFAKIVQIVIDTLINIFIIKIISGISKILIILSHMKINMALSSSENFRFLSKQASKHFFLKNKIPLIDQSAIQSSSIVLIPPNLIHRTFIQPFLTTRYKEDDR